MASVPRIGDRTIGLHHTAGVLTTTVDCAAIPLGPIHDEPKATPKPAINEQQR